MTDKELRRELERSPEDGFRRLFDEYCGYVYAICANKLRGSGSPEDVDECVGDAFAAAFRYFSRGGGRDGELKGVIGVIARRTAISYFRRLAQKCGETLSIDDDGFGELPADSSVEETAERDALQETVLRCVEALEEPDRSVIVYYYYYGIKTKEIASLVGMNSAAVQQRLHRARKKLKKLLSEAGVEEDVL